MSPETPDTVGKPLFITQPRLVLLEIWHPLRFIGRPGPRIFWRECLPVPPFEGGPWRVMDKEFDRKIRAMRNSHFTLDEYPGVTFTMRKFNDPDWSDWVEARALREGAV